MVCGHNHIRKLALARHYSSSIMSGFDCEFVSKPPEVLQTHCPVCLLILCEPYQVTCCGTSFCKECIKEIKARSQPCPTCKEDSFESFPNKGLQRPLYGFAVFCSNKERGCVWEGELGQLDQHINSNPDKEKQLVGCAYVSIACLSCDKLHPRHELEHHQTSFCPKRPFACFMCEEYVSTYEDVVNSHAPVCKCRPVECPNSCGADNLQHQHLEEHVSSQCPLTYMKCEFSDAGCDAKVYRKDLASHLTDNLVTHMSLLAMENRKLKQQLQKQEEIAVATIRKLGQQLESQEQRADVDLRMLRVQLKKQEGIAAVQHRNLKKQREWALMENRKLKEDVKIKLQQQLILGRCQPSQLELPIDLVCPSKIRQEGGCWSSVPFNSPIGSCKLQVKVLSRPCFSGVGYKIYIISQSASPKLQVTIDHINQLNGTTVETFLKDIVKEIPDPCRDPPDFQGRFENDFIQLRVTKIRSNK